MKNTQLIESEYNVTFEEILQMSEAQFHDWAVGLRKEVVNLWDNHDLPPVTGYSDEEIIDQFKYMQSYPIFHHKDGLEKTDEDTGKLDVIRNTTNLGNAVNSFFPAMMKTPIGYKGDGTGRSIYDFFANDDLLERFKTYARRHFKRDSFYHYSNPIKQKDNRFGERLMVNTGLEFVYAYMVNPDYFDKSMKIGFWLCPVKDKGEYTGYDEKLKGQKYLTLNRKEIEGLMSAGVIYNTSECSMNIDWDRSEIYTIRVFEREQRIFPAGFKAFKISFSQYAVNFPPLTARYLYEYYTKHVPKTERIVVYDPSMGWGGRLLGALSAHDDVKLHYVGTDPNTDNHDRYQRVYDTFTKNVKGWMESERDHTTMDKYCLGSEVIHENPDFQKYRGKIDFAFTSPPYFEKEQYSQEETQSFKKFPKYDLWVEGFLRPTIKTICEYLKNDRYAVWNVADVKFGEIMLPLEADSIKAFQDYGMVYQGVRKMALAPMPGGNRVDADGKGTAKNTCRVNGLLLKYEPLLVFYKP